MSIAYAPFNLLRYAAPIDIALVGLAFSILLATPGRRWPIVAPILFTCAAVTFVMFGSPGIGENHMLDVCVLSIVAIVSLAASLEGPSISATILLAFFALLNVAYPALRTGATAAEDRFTVRSGAEIYGWLASELGPAEKGPILAENPWIPLSRGERPFVLDAFNLRILANADRRIRDDLDERLRDRFFRSVVLSRPLEGNELWYEQAHFGAGFADVLRRNYCLAARSTPGQSTTGIYVYRPRKERAPDDLPHLNRSRESEDERSLDLCRADGRAEGSSGR